MTGGWRAAHRHHSQTGLVSRPLRARKDGEPRSRSLAVKTPSPPALALPIVDQSPFLSRWIRTFPLLGAFPQANRVRFDFRSVTNGKRNDAAEGFGAPSAK